MGSERTGTRFDQIDSRSFDVYANPIFRYRIARMSWLLFRRPVRNLGFPATHERLITSDELLRLMA